MNIFCLFSDKSDHFPKHCKHIAFFVLLLYKLVGKIWHLGNWNENKITKLLEMDQQRYSGWLCRRLNLTGLALNSGDGEEKKKPGKESIKLKFIRCIRFYRANSASSSIWHKMERRKLEKLVKDAKRNVAISLSVSFLSSTQTGDIRY